MFGCIDTTLLHVAFIVAPKCGTLSKVIVSSRSRNRCAMMKKMVTALHTISYPCWFGNNVNVSVPSEIAQVNVECGVSDPPIQYVVIVSSQFETSETDSDKRKRRIQSSQMKSGILQHHRISVFPVYVSVFLISLLCAFKLKATVYILLSCLLAVSISQEGDPDARVRSECNESRSRRLIRKILMFFVYSSAYNFCNTEEIGFLEPSSTREASLSTQNTARAELQSNSDASDGSRKLRLASKWSSLLTKESHEHESMDALLEKDIQQDDSTEFRKDPFRIHANQNHRSREKEHAEPHVRAKCIFHHCIMPWSIAT